MRIENENMNCFVLSQWHLAKIQVSFGCEVTTMNDGVCQLKNND